MTVINMMAINEAPFIQVQNITIHRTTTIPVNTDILNKDSLNVLIQEFEARRLYVDNVAGLFDAAGHILNADGTGSNGEAGSGIGGGAGDCIDIELRNQIGSRATDYLAIFNEAII